MYDEDTLYVYRYSDFDEDYVFMETKYELSDVKRLEQENKHLKEQLQQKEDIINKAKEYCNHGIKEYITDDGFVEEVLRDIKKILDNKGE